MKTDINFRHLYYFWVVANEGGITRAAERLGLAVQTVSSQLTLLEQSLGKTLFAQQGRRLVLTEAGRLALGYADQLFLLGEQMQEALSEFDSGRTRLTVGISDSLPNLSAYRMLEAVTRMERPVRLVCYEDQFEALLADLALHKLDVVLTDREVRAGTTLKVFSHQLFDSEMVVVGTPALAQRYGGAGDGFPQNLNGAPFLLPARNNALRGKLDEWFVQHHVRPDVVGEFEDSALLAVFAARGLGVFPVSRLGAGDAGWMHGLRPLGRCDEVTEEIHAIRSRRGQHHPLVLKIIEAARA